MRNADRCPLRVVAAVLVFCACRWNRDPRPAPPLGAVSASTVPRPATFATVQPLLQRACAETCHDGRVKNADDFLFKDEGDLRRRLLGAAPGTVPPACQGRPLVVPGYPDRSLLVAMVQEAEGPRADCAERMPHICPERRPCLSVDEIRSIRVWIEAGALP